MKRMNVKRAVAIVLACTLMSAAVGLPVVAFADWTQTSSNKGNIIRFGRKSEYVWAQEAQDLAAAGLEGYKLDGKVETTAIDLIEKFGEENLTATFTPNGGEEVEVSAPDAFSPMSAGELKIYPNKAWYTNTPLTVPVRFSEAYSVNFRVEYPAWYKETFDVVTIGVTDSDNVTETYTPVKEEGDESYKIILPAGEYDFSLESLCFRADAASEKVILENVTVDGAVSKSVKFAVPRLHTTKTVTYTESGFSLPKGNNTCSPLRGAGIPNSDGTPSRYKYVTANAGEGFVVSYKVLASVANNNGAWWSDGGFCFKIGEDWYTLMVHSNKGTETNSARIAFSKQKDGKYENLFYANTSVELKQATAEPREIEIAFHPEDVTINGKSCGAFYVRIKGATEGAVRIGPELFDSARSGETNASKLPVWITDAQRAIFRNGTDGNKSFGTFTTDEYFGSAQRILGFRSIDAENTFTDVQYRIGTEYARERIKEMRKLADAMEADGITDGNNPWPAWSVIGTEEQNYGRLTISKIENLAVGSSAEIKATFSVNKYKSEISYTFEGQDISIENNTVTALVPDKTVKVTAKTKYHETTFTVTTVGDFGRLIVRDTYAWIDYPASEYTLEFTAEKEVVNYGYDPEKIEIDPEAKTVKALVEGTHKVTVSSAHHSESFNVICKSVSKPTTDKRWLTLDENYARKLQTEYAGKGTNGKTTLFIGDSFFDTRWFWTDFASVYAGKDAICAGVSSTTTYDWENYMTENIFLTEMSPKNIVMDMGTNNFYDDGDTVSAVIENLQRIFTLMHSKMPDTNIYYFSIAQRTNRNFKGQVTETNAAMKEWCEYKSWITFIDVEKELTSDMLRDDGVHPSLDTYKNLYVKRLEEAGCKIENK